MLFAKASTAEREALRLACEQDLLTFTALMFRARMAQPFLVNWHHARIVDALMAVYRGEIHNLLITMPPGGTKTELAVIHFMAWCFARSPHCRFLHLSGAAELAACRGVLEKMPFADRACGFFCDRAALAAWPAFDALQLRLDTLPVYGSLEELLPPMGKETLDEAVRAAASALYHAACHTALFDAQPEAALPALQKAAFFALRLAHCRRSGQYTAARQSLLPKLEPEERALLGKDCTLPALMAWARGEMES